jgi:TatD DNase family protein
VLDQGLCVSFTGNITYKNSRLPEVARALPLDRILLETDAPFMAPVPYRGKRCEPARVREVALKLAEIHRVPPEEVDRLTSTAAHGVFFSN